MLSPLRTSRIAAGALFVRSGECADDRGGEQGKDDERGERKRDRRGDARTSLGAAQERDEREDRADQCKNAARGQAKQDQHHEEDPLLKRLGVIGAAELLVDLGIEKREADGKDRQGQQDPGDDGEHFFHDGVLL